MVMMSKSGDQECPVIFNMIEFNEQKNNNTEWYSDSFYTHSKGYKMCLNVHAVEAIKGIRTRLSLYLYVMKGSYDDELTWPLRGEFEIKLLNQISDSEHHSEIVTYDDSVLYRSRSRVKVGDRATEGWGFYRFILSEDLHMTTGARQYLRDDCLFFQLNFKV